MSEMTLDEAKKILDEEELRFIAYNQITEAKSVISAAGDPALAVYLDRADKFLNGEIARLTDNKVEDKDKVFTYEQLAQMPQVFAEQKLEPAALTSAEQALHDVVYLRLKEIVDSKNLDLDPIAYAGIMELAQQHDVKGVKEAIKRAAHRYDAENGISSDLNADMLNRGAQAFEDIIQSIDLDNDEELKTARVIASNLRMVNDEGQTVDRNGEPVEEAVDLVSDIIDTSVLAANQHLAGDLKFIAADASERRKMVVREINFQTQLAAYQMLLKDMVYDNISREDVANPEQLKKKVPASVFDKINRTMERISSGEMFEHPENININTVMGSMVTVSGNFDSWLTRQYQRLGKTVGLDKMSHKLDNYIAEKQSGWKGWKYVSMANECVKKAAPSIATGMVLGTGVMAAGMVSTVAAVPVATAYGLFRIHRSLKPLLDKYKVALEKDPDAKFMDTVKANKLTSARTVVGTLIGGASIATAGAAVFTAVSESRLALRTASSAAMASLASTGVLGALHGAFKKGATWEERKKSLVRAGVETSVLAMSVLGLASCTSEDTHIDAVLADVQKGKEGMPSMEELMKAANIDPNKLPTDSVARHDAIHAALKEANITNGEAAAELVFNHNLDEFIGSAKPEEISKTFEHLQTVGLLEGKVPENPTLEQQKALVAEFMKANKYSDFNQVDAAVIETYVDGLDEKEVAQYISDWQKIGITVEDKAKIAQLLTEHKTIDIETLDSKLWGEKFTDISSEHPGTGIKFYAQKLGLVSEDGKVYTSDVKKYMLENNILDSKGFDNAIWSASVKDIKPEDVSTHLSKLGLSEEDMKGLADDAAKLAKLHELATARGALTLEEVSLAEQIPALKPYYLEEYAGDASLKGDAQVKAFLDNMRKNGVTDIEAVTNQLHDSHVAINIDTAKIANLNLGIEGVDNSSVTTALQDGITDGKTDLAILKANLEAQNISEENVTKVLTALQSQGVMASTPAPEDIPVTIDPAKIEAAEIKIEGVDAAKVKAAITSLKDVENPTKADLDHALKAQGIEAEKVEQVNEELKKAEVAVQGNPVAGYAGNITELPKYDENMGISKRQFATLLATRKPEEVIKMYNNLTPQVMEKFPGLTKEQLMYKYNRMDAWTARVKVVDGKLVQLLGADGKTVQRYQMQEEMIILKKVIECGETVDEQKLTVAREALVAHIKADGDTDLSGTRTQNVITSLEDKGCDDNNHASGIAGTPPPERHEENLPPAQVPVTVPDLYEAPDNKAVISAYEAETKTKEVKLPYIQAKHGNINLRVSADGKLIDKIVEVPDDKNHVALYRLNPDGETYSKDIFNRKDMAFHVETHTVEVPYTAPTAEEVAEAAKNLKLEPGRLVVTEGTGEKAGTTGYRMLTEHGVIVGVEKDGVRNFKLMGLDGKETNSIPENVQKEELAKAEQAFKALDNQKLNASKEARDAVVAKNAAAIAATRGKGR